MAALTMPIIEMPERADIATRFQFDLSIPVKRVALADLNSSAWHKWLLERLGEKWPHIGMANFAGHSRAWIDSNEFLFMRAGGAVALAARWTEPLTIQPIVREIFVFVADKRTATWRKEALRLYREMQIWAATMGASGVIIGSYSDVTSGRLEEMTGAEQRVSLWVESRRN